MFSEFKDFLLKANVLALALAFIVGVALAAVVNSLVKDILMPPVGLLLGGVDFNSLYINLSGGSYPTPQGGAGRRRGDDQLRRVHQHGDHVHHRRVRCVPDRAVVRAKGRTDEGLLVLRRRDPGVRDAVPVLHQPAGAEARA